MDMVCPERTSATILAHHNGKRTDAACQKLSDKLAVFPIRYYYTDNWSSDTQAIPVAQHMHVNSLLLHIVRCQVFIARFYDVERKRKMLDKHSLSSFHLINLY